MLGGQYQCIFLGTLCDCELKAKITLGTLKMLKDLVRYCKLCLIKS